MTAQSFRFKVGAFDCAALSDGSNDYPPKNFFSNVPEAEWQAVLRQHNLPIEHVTTPYTLLYIDTGTHKVLVDTGTGIWPWTDRVGFLPASLATLGLSQDDIDTVIISHAHPDHVGGNLNEDGSLAYANARYYIWRVDWDFWMSEAAETQAPEGHVKTARRNLEPIRDRVTLLDAAGEILPGIHAVEAPGHTPGHLAVEIESEGERLLHVVDTVLYPLHLEYPDWKPVYDILPDKAAISKQTIFDRAAAENLLVFAHHFPPFPNLGHIAKENTGWRWLPLEV